MSIHNRVETFRINRLLRSLVAAISDSVIYVIVVWCIAVLPGVSVKNRNLYKTLTYGTTNEEALEKALPMEKLGTLEKVVSDLLGNDETRRQMQ